ncbi:MAG: DNA translocase FtsK [Candidatus Paceibacterota bacterium]|jgi:DNA segregation ATPase FtsK/SpoIIIE-like protein|nr:hypothetical protein [Candidatus Paceibacterota bacterium]
MKLNENEEVIAMIEDMNERLKLLAKKQDSIHSDLTMTLHIIETKIDRLSNSRPLERSAFPVARRMLEAEYENAKELSIKIGKVSASSLQKLLGIGDAHAAALLTMLEERGVIGPSKGKKEREVLPVSFERKLGARYAKASHLLHKTIEPITKRKSKKTKEKGEEDQA